MLMSPSTHVTCHHRCPRYLGRCRYLIDVKSISVCNEPPCKKPLERARHRPEGRHVLPLLPISHAIYPPMLVQDSLTSSIRCQSRYHMLRFFLDIRPYRTFHINYPAFPFFLQLLKAHSSLPACVVCEDYTILHTALPLLCPGICMNC